MTEHLNGGLGKLVGGLVGLLLAFLAGAGIQDQVGIVSDKAPLAPAPLGGRTAEEICLDPNAEVYHLVGGLIPRYQVSLQTVDQDGRLILYTLTVAEEQGPTPTVAVERSIQGMPDETDSEPLSAGLQACIAQKAQERSEGGE